MASVKVGATSVTLTLAKGEKLEIPLGEWLDFISAVKAGSLDVTTPPASAALAAGTSVQRMPNPVTKKARKTYQGFRAPSRPGGENG